MKLEGYEQWWEKNVGSSETYTYDGESHATPKLENFDSWMGDAFSADRIYVRREFNEKAKTLLDVACGTAPEYTGLQKKRPDIEYTGLDITPKLVDYCKAKGINVVNASANDIPFGDNSFDIVHTRHSLEHMKHFKDAIREFIRVAKMNIYISFFIEPVHGPSIISEITPEQDHYNNTYNKTEIEDLLKKCLKVKQFNWLTLGGKSKTLLSINLNA